MTKKILALCFILIMLIIKNGLSQFYINRSSYNYFVKNAKIQSLAGISSIGINGLDALEANPAWLADNNSRFKVQLDFNYPFWGYNGYKEDLYYKRTLRLNEIFDKLITVTYSSQVSKIAFLYTQRSRIIKFAFSAGLYNGFSSKWKYEENISGVKRNNFAIYNYKSIRNYNLNIRKIFIATSMNIFKKIYLGLSTSFPFDEYYEYSIRVKDDIYYNINRFYKWKIRNSSPQFRLGLGIKYKMAGIGVEFISANSYSIYGGYAIYNNDVRTERSDSIVYAKYSFPYQLNIGGYFNVSQYFKILGELNNKNWDKFKLSFYRNDYNQFTNSITYKIGLEFSDILRVGYSKDYILYLNKLIPVHIIAFGISLSPFITKKLSIDIGALYLFNNTISLPYIYTDNSQRISTTGKYQIAYGNLTFSIKYNF